MVNELPTPQSNLGLDAWLLKTALGVLATLQQQLEQKTALSPSQVAEAVRELVSDESSPEAKANFLSALAQKGESVEEIAAFAAQLRERSVQPELDAVTRAGEILDVCGTGGDR